jgi:hypothetical protein
VTPLKAESKVTKRGVFQLTLFQTKGKTIKEGKIFQFILEGGECVYRAKTNENLSEILVADYLLIN